jgi:LPS export ABC transporter protein LptC
MNFTLPKKTSTYSQQAAPGSNLRKHFLAILVLSAAMFYLLDSATDDEVLAISRLLELQAQDYDYFMSNVDSVHYLESGFADYRFQATRLTHFPNPELSILETPRFLLFSEDNSAWEIKAVNGSIEFDSSRNQDRLELSENVIINGLTADGRAINIYTDSLTIYPVDKQLSTESPVLFESVGFRSTSLGITADLDASIFRQMADGKFQYDN